MRRESFFLLFSATKRSPNKNQLIRTNFCSTDYGNKQPKQKTIKPNRKFSFPIYRQQNSKLQRIYKTPRNRWDCRRGQGLRAGRGGRWWRPSRPPWSSSYPSEPSSPISGSSPPFFVLMLLRRGMLSTPFFVLRLCFERWVFCNGKRNVKMFWTLSWAVW